LPIQAGSLEGDTEILKKTTIKDPENVECLGSSIFREVASVNPKDHISGIRPRNSENIMPLPREDYDSRRTDDFNH
jgi:hypothetical protein